MASEALAAELISARAVAAKAGLGTVVPEVMKLAKHTSLRLSPLPIVARIQSRTSPFAAQEALARELMIATHLARHSAPAVRPTSNVEPGPYFENGCSITLWELVEGRPAESEADASAALAALRTTHDALDDIGIELPSFTVAIDTCETILSNPSSVPKLRESDRLFLHKLHSKLRQELDRHELHCRPIHGDAHLGNVLITPSGAVWMDLETVCMGPLEWDLLSLPPSSWSEFGLDSELAHLLKELRSLCVATWCWADIGKSAEADEAASYHLEWLKSRFS